MKKKISIAAVLIVLLIFAGCSTSQTSNVEAESKTPFDVYEYKDSDGCDYLVVYVKERAMNGNGLGVGTGMTQKVKQPEACKN